MGAPGDKAPLSGSVILRKPNESYGALGRGLRQLFIDLVAIRKPDLVIWEAPWSIEAWFQHCLKKKRSQNGMSIVIQNHLALSLMALCDGREISWQEVNRQTVLKHFTGNARHASAPGAEDGRENGKKAVLARCHQLRYLPDLCMDDDRADSLANWDMACALYGGRIDKELLLHDQGKMKFQSED